MFDLRANPWTVLEADFPIDDTPSEQLHFLLSYAILAPSEYNTQPWRFKVTNRAIELYADRSRRLPRLDPDDRELTISCGAAFLNLRLALRHFGYAVTEALNGEEGIAKARSERPDLILMDISIPVIDGWEATQVLKHDPQTREIPIIALTAHALASDREKAMEVGCDGYLAKPCEPRAVVAEVQRFLGKGDGSTS